ELQKLLDRVAFGASHVNENGAVDLLAQRLQNQIREMPELAAKLQTALVEDPPLALKEGGIFRDGFDRHLDELRSASRDGKNWINALQEREIEATGIKSLKVRFNSVFGYFIEITKSNLGNVPPRYTRKQTTVGGERFITPELKEMEAKVLGADERARNLAGKSTYIRQVALIVLIAQIGSFVPASAAEIGIVDRIFTRVGASDDLSRGQSTFMVEMNETANIVNNATERSLVILDEIGRGTSTFDGLSIAWSVAEFLHDRIKARTLFATHYHELTRLAAERSGVINFNVAVREWNDQIIFLRKIVPGGADKSYGIQVARLA